MMNYDEFDDNGKKHAQDLCIRKDYSCNSIENDKLDPFISFRVLFIPVRFGKRFFRRADIYSFIWICM